MTTVVTTVESRREPLYPMTRVLTHASGMRIDEKGWTIVVRSNQYHQLRADSGEIRVRFPATYWRTLDQCCVFAGAAGEAENDVMQTSGGYGVTVYNANERMLHETRLYPVAPVSTNFVFAFRAEHELDLPRSCR